MHCSPAPHGLVAATHPICYDWLGRAITDIQPDIVWESGDWWDLSSLCHWDAGTKSFEGRRYWADIAAGIDAMERVEAQLADYNRG